MPTVFVDITAVYDKKLAAMAEMKAQQYLQSYYAERAGHRLDEPGPDEHRRPAPAPL